MNKELYESLKEFLRYRDTWDFLGLPNSDAPFCDVFFYLTIFSGSSTGTTGDF